MIRGTASNSEQQQGVVLTQPIGVSWVLSLLAWIRTSFLLFLRTPSLLRPLPVIPSSEDFGHQTIILKQYCFCIKDIENAKHRCWFVWNDHNWLKNSSPKQGDMMLVVSMYSLVIGKSRIYGKFCEQLKMIFQPGENFRNYLQLEPFTMWLGSISSRKPVMPVLVSVYQRTLHITSVVFKMCSKTSSISISWKCVRKANSWLPPQICSSETLSGTLKSVEPSPPGYSDACSSLRTPASYGKTHHIKAVLFYVCLHIGLEVVWG